MDRLPGKETSPAQREAIIALHLVQIPVREISRRLNIPKRTIHRWIKLFTERQSLENRPLEVETPRITTRVQDKMIVDAVKGQPLITAVAVKQQLGLQICVQTVRNRLHGAGLHHRIPARKPLLTQQHKEARMGFALQYLPEDASFWDLVIFCIAEENIEPSRRSGRISAGLWGWMAASGRES
ncbi:uncharacterized protein LOC135218815 [Macrobrachium nipponense]|uniref:uncharacterized protein LOC135218815 n=1 Tax=Macrobrachium nipponense TaxID=159736 RepID=UPI0030C84FAE